MTDTHLHLLREMDHRVFVVVVTTLSDAPIVRRSWYPTGIDAWRARDNIGEFEGVDVRYLGDGTYRMQPGPHDQDVRLRLEGGGRTECERHDQFEIPMPKTRRRGKVYWNMGEWWIHGAHGDEILAQVDLRPYAMM